MKCRIGRSTLVILFTTTLVLSAAATAQAGDSACSLARAAGTYGASDSGTIVGVGPRATVARLTLDATGNVNAKVTANVNGAITNPTLSGTYTVDSDCTGTASFKELDQSGNTVLAATAVLVWDANMREIRFLFTSVLLAGDMPLQTVISGSARKMVP